MGADSGFATMQRPGTWRRLAAAVAITFALGAATGGWVAHTFSQGASSPIGQQPVQAAAPVIDLSAEAPPGSFMYQKTQAMRALHRLYLDGKLDVFQLHSEPPPPGSFMYQKEQEARALHRLYLAEIATGLSRDDTEGDRG